MEGFVGKIIQRKSMIDGIEKLGQLACGIIERENFGQSPLYNLTRIYKCLNHINNRQAPSIRAAVPVHTPLLSLVSTSHPQTMIREDTHINHCRVLNFTPSTLSLSPATSCSIRVSVSLIFNSCTLASSLIRPFSRFRSNLTLACVRLISSRRREFSLARSLVRRSWEARVRRVSVESEERSSERSLVKSTFWV